MGRGGAHQRSEDKEDVDIVFPATSLGNVVMKSNPLSDLNGGRSAEMELATWASKMEVQEVEEEEEEVIEEEEEEEVEEEEKEEDNYDGDENAVEVLVDPVTKKRYTWNRTTEETAWLDY